MRVFRNLKTSGKSGNEKSVYVHKWYEYKRLNLYVSAFICNPLKTTRTLQFRGDDVKSEQKNLDSETHIQIQTHIHTEWETYSHS